MMRVAAFVSLWMMLASVPAAAQPEFRLEPAFPALFFDHPVDIQHARDGSDRLFVVEQDGVIRVFENRAEVTESEVFLDIRARVQNGGEQGLLGLAFHPQYAQNGFFYVYYSAANPRRSVVARYTVDPSNPDRADASSELVLLEVGQPFSNHNGGQIGFGPDGFFYIALGDGGSGGDPEGHGQNRRTLLGSILRIDVDNPAGGMNYGIPADNPFVGNTEDFREEIYAYGLRNPWRFSFDPETGDLWTGDVGQGAFEEIDLVENGGNYGWNLMEGTRCFPPSRDCSGVGLVMPVFEYPHQGNARSVTGGHVYRGSLAPALVGQYLYADFITGEIWALQAEGGVALANERLFDTNLNIASFGVDEQQELYLTAFDGRIYSIIQQEDTAIEEAPPEAPARLLPAHPNPFRTATTLALVLDRSAHVALVVYDVQGRRVRVLAEGRHPAGTHTLRWEGHDADGAAVAGGVYFLQLTVEGVPVAGRPLVRLP